MPDRYAVIGNPINHSLSPQIHTEFAKHTQQDLVYEKICVEENDFEEFVADFFAGGGKGLNITIPFKQKAWQAAKHHSQSAMQAKAVNTLHVNKYGELEGNNTDGVGLVNDLMKNYKIDLSNKSILVIGAGGAVRGVLDTLLQQQPAKLILTNRTFSKVEDLYNELIKNYLVSNSKIYIRKLEELIELVDLIINGTAASLHAKSLPLNPKILANNPVCYDMVYGSKRTSFNQWAVDHGVSEKNVLDGLGMLVEQAAESFYIWRGVRPDTKPIIEKIKASL